MWENWRHSRIKLCGKQLSVEKSKKWKMSLIGMHTGPQIHATVPLKVSNALQRIYEIDSEIKFISFKAAHGRFPLDVRKGGVLGLTPPLSLIFYKNFITCGKGIKLFSHTFCLLILQLNANTTEWICMQISRNIVNGPKSNNYVLVGIWVVVCIHHFLQTFRQLRVQAYLIAFRDSSLYPKQLSLVLSAMAEQRKRWPHWLRTDFCSMKELLHELKKLI